MQTKTQHRVYMWKWSKEHKESMNKSQKQIRECRKAQILRAKDKPCHDCGIKYNSWQMQFDHRDPKTKCFNVGGAWTRSINSLVDEINKCDVVCANCHAQRTHNLKQKGAII